MTDKEIIFSLECCDNGKCSECSFAFKGGCVLKLRTRAYDLINRQQAEIEKLKDNKQIEVSERLEKEIRSEATKEFAERLKDIQFDNGFDSPDIDFDYFIDNIVKEMINT